MSRRGAGQKCSYCRRTLEAVGSRGAVEATRDHIVPKSRGGLETVWACFICNNLKADMMPDEWAAFMAAHPEWWRGLRRTRVNTPRRPPYNPDPELLRITRSYDFNMRVMREGRAVKQEIKDWGAIEWRWLKELVASRVAQVGFGPWT